MNTCCPTFEAVFETTNALFEADFETSNADFSTDFSSVQVYIKSDHDMEHYEGDYDITPLITTQVMGTKDKIMDDDVTIEMIPTKEIENEAGGVSFIIG